MFDRFVILPSIKFNSASTAQKYSGEKVPLDFNYSSDTNTSWMKKETFLTLLVNMSQDLGMKVLILGAYGRLGVHLSEHLSQSGFDIVRQGRSSLSELQIDPTIYESLSRALDELKPEAIVNLTALTDI